MAGGELGEPAAFGLPSPRATAGRALLAARVLRYLERESLWLFVVAAFAVLLAARLPVLVAPDTWFALVGGREIVEHGIPREDALAVWTAGAQWVNQQWLAHLAIYSAVAAGGLRLALLVHVGLLLATIVLVLVAGRRLGASPRSTAIGGALCFLGVSQAAVLRGQTLALPLFALLLWLLVRDARTPSIRVLLALPIVALWANVHGTAALAALLVAVRGVDCFRRRRAVALALVAGAPAALLATPYGTAVFAYYERTVGNRSFSRFVTEWAPPTFPDDWPAFVLAGVGVWLVARHGSHLTRYEKVIFAVLLLGALSANRNAVWLALFSAMVLPRLVDVAWPATTRSPPRRLNIAVWSTIALAVTVVAAPAFLREPAWYEQRYPAEAADRVEEVLRADPDARVFASEWFADWLLWKVPEARGRVAFDVRFELLTSAQLMRMSEFTNAAEGWRGLLRGYRVVVLKPDTQGRNERALLADAGVRTLFRDEEMSVLLLPH